MEPDRDGGRAEQGPASVDPEQRLSNGISERANSPPIPTEMASKPNEHDSLVTVRLSEPPSLHLDTAVPPSTVLTRKSPAPPDYGSSNAAAEAEEEDDDDDDSDSEIFEPETSAAKRGPNLQQELGKAAAGSLDDDEATRRRESWSSSGSERVDWEELQKKEDAEFKTKGSHQVRHRRFRARLVAV